MQEPQRNYCTRELPWHAFQRLLAEELEEQGRDGQAHAELPLHSWLARALAGATVAHRC